MRNERYWLNQMIDHRRELLSAEEAHIETLRTNIDALTLQLNAAKHALGMHEHLAETHRNAIDANEARLAELDPARLEDSSSDHALTFEHVKDVVEMLKKRDPRKTIQQRAFEAEVAQLVKEIEG